MPRDVIVTNEDGRKYRVTLADEQTGAPSAATPSKSVAQVLNERYPETAKTGAFGGKITHPEGWPAGVTPRAPAGYEPSDMLSGLGRMAKGVMRAPREPAGAVSDVFRGGLEAATPYIQAGLARAALQAPIRTGLGVGLGTAAQQGAEQKARESGMPEGAAALTGDVTGVLSGIAPYAGTAAARAFGLPEFLQKSAKSNYAQALLRGGGSKHAKEAAMQAIEGQPASEGKSAVPGLMERGFMAFSKGSLEKKLGGKVDAANERLNKLVAALPEDASVPLNELVGDMFSAAREKFTVKGTAPTAGYEADMNATRDLMSRASQFAHKDSTGQLVVPIRDVLALKQRWDAEVAQRKGYTSATPDVTPGTMPATRSAAGVAREAVAKVSPELAEANRQDRVWRLASDVFDETLQRTLGHASTSLGGEAARIAGAAMGAPAGVGAALAGAEAAKAGHKFMKGTGYQTGIGQLKYRLGRYMAAPQEPIPDVTETPPAPRPSWSWPVIGGPTGLPVKSARESAQVLMPPLSGKSAAEAAPVLARAPEIDTTPAPKGPKSARESAGILGVHLPKSAAEAAEVFSPGASYSSPQPEPAPLSQSQAAINRWGTGQRLTEYQRGALDLAKKLVSAITQPPPAPPSTAPASRRAYPGPQPSIEEINAIAQAMNQLESAQPQPRPPYPLDALRVAPPEAAVRRGELEQAFGVRPPLEQMQGAPPERAVRQMELEGAFGRKKHNQPYPVMPRMMPPTP